MRTELDFQTFEEWIVRNNTELLFEILTNRANDASRSHPKKTSHHQQSIVNQQSCQSGYWKEARANEAKRMINKDDTIAENY